MATRSGEKARAAIEDLKQETGREAIFLELDLSSLRDIKAAADEFLQCVYNGFKWAMADSCIDQERNRTPRPDQQRVRLTPSL